MKIQVLYFASLRETIGVGREAIETACTHVASLREELMAQSALHARCLAKGQPVRVAVNQVMADDSTALYEGCEVAFFPPVTGG